ncbi:MAG: hypothetical protein HEQ16_13860 [Bosea sp.]|jgi:hypothetical protein|nr:hypothetical protein [Bosea sp. (in: a-proteobacteria)]
MTAYQIISSGRAAANMTRSRKAVPVRPVPRADGMIWTFVALLLLMAGGCLAAGLWWINRPAQPPQLLDMRIGGERLVIPSNYKGPRTADMGREVGMTRLRVTWPGLLAATAEEVAQVHITLGPSDASTDPAAQFATLARFLTPGAWSNPGGLVVRNFKKGSPFESEELYMSLPDGAEFFARCTADLARIGFDEGCRAVIKHTGIDIRLRFPREALAEWRALSDAVKQLVDGFRRPE